MRAIVGDDSRVILASTKCDVIIVATVTTATAVAAIGAVGDVVAVTIKAGG